MTNIHTTPTVFKKPASTDDGKWPQYAFVLDGRGGAQYLSPEGLADWTPEKGVLWLHLDLNSVETKEWVEQKSGLDDQITELLLDEDDVRPRCMAFGDGLLLFLRAVNLNPGEEMDDMISVRIFAEQERVITIRESPLLSMIDVEQKLVAGRGPKDAAQLLDEICYVNLDKIVECVDDFDDRMNEIEEFIIKGGDTDNFVSALSEMRRALTEMRRYLSPQRYALDVLSRQVQLWISSENQYEFRENANLMMRVLDDIGSLRERALINIDELDNLARGETQKTINALSVLATVFIPMTVITGLLGMNVGGIPLAEDPNGLWYITGFMMFLASIQLYVFKRLKWL